MQETRTIDSALIRQRLFGGETHEEIQSLMDADVRADEEVVRRREVTPEEFRGFNRHQRRKMAALARKR